MHEQEQNYTYEFEYDDDYAWNSSWDDQYFGSYMVQAADRMRRFRPSLPRAVWDSLSKLDQQTWDQVSIKGKWDIIRGLRQTVSTTKNDSNASNTGPSIAPSSSHNNATKLFLSKPKEINNTVIENDQQSQGDTNTMPTALSSVTEPTFLTP